MTRALVRQALVVATLAAHLARGRSVLPRSAEDQALVSTGAAAMGIAAGTTGYAVVSLLGRLVGRRAPAATALAGAGFAAYRIAGTRPGGKAASIAEAAGAVAIAAVGAGEAGRAVYEREPWLARGLVVGTLASFAGAALVAGARLRRRLAEPTDLMKESVTYEYLPTVSGGDGSLAPRAALDREGRKFLGLAVPSRAIAEIVGEPARDPIRVYVGLGHAATPPDRARLALAELERLGGFDRRRIVVVCPSGAGFVVPPPIQAEELMSRGDVASVVVQYNNQRSHRSLGKVGIARETYRVLFEGLRERLRRIEPDQRPAVVVYGESLGAWIPADMVADGGLRLLDEFHVAGGALVGVPYRPRRRLAEMRAREGALPESVGVVSAGSELDELDTAAQERLRYVLLTHPEDPVSNFAGARLIWERPRTWLPRRGRHPRVPPKMRWLPGITYLHLLFDVKNATSFGPEFTAYGHDYRLELPNVVRVAFGHLEVSRETLSTIAAWTMASAREQAAREGRTCER